MKGGLAHRETIPPCATLGGNAGVTPEGVVLGGGDGGDSPADLVRRATKIRGVLAVGLHGRDVFLLLGGGIVRAEKRLVFQEGLVVTPQLDAGLVALVARVVRRHTGRRVVHRLGWIDNGLAHAVFTSRMVVR